MFPGRTLGRPINHLEPISNPGEPSARTTLLSFNTVERLLNGDFFHTVHWGTVASELSRFPEDWILAGVGTTSWYDRNGETIIGGTVGNPTVNWSDPRSQDPMHVIDLLNDRPSSDGPDLVNPALSDTGNDPAFPFFAMGIGNPGNAQTLQVPKGAKLHDFLISYFEEQNIGLAAVRLSGTCRHVNYAAAFHLPLEGLGNSDCYSAEDSFRLAQREGGSWNVSGVYAANPTLQRIISVEGLPLHLHGYEETDRMGGHLSEVVADSLEATIYPLQDFLLEIRNLDRAHLPVRPVP